MTPHSLLFFLFTVGAHAFCDSTIKTFGAPKHRCLETSPATRQLWSLSPTQLQLSRSFGFQEEDVFSNEQQPQQEQTHKRSIGRREALLLPMLSTFLFSASALPPTFFFSSAAWAYTPDSDPLRESLYLMSRVQEATVQQERFVNTAMLSSSSQEELKQKMKLTLRLVEKNYRLVDQINYASQFVQPNDDIVAATNAGLEAADALQNAIDYVNLQLKNGPLLDSQADYLKTNLSTCRQELFKFLRYMPTDKLDQARKRVEEENVLNREEFDGPDTAGVYNPVILPWKQQTS